MTVRGVRLGLITGSLNPLPETPGRDPIDVIIEQCQALGVVDVELVTVFPQGAPQVVNGGRFGQPPAAITPEYTKTRQALREWRIAQPLDRFREVRAKFDKAGLNLFSYVQTIDDHMTDAEIDADVPADAGVEGPDVHDQPDARADGSSHRAVRGDVRHPGGLASARAGAGSQRGGDGREHGKAARRCRRRSSSTSTSGTTPPATTTRWRSCASTTTASRTCTSRTADATTVRTSSSGTGDTPIKECVMLVRDQRWPIRLTLEREYRDAPGTPVEQTRWQLNYLKALLES